MKRVREGVSGELTWEIFETLVPVDPKFLLLDFLHSERDSFSVIRGIDFEHVVFTRIDREYAKRLLEEAEK